jgi:hypothetical protein
MHKDDMIRLAREAGWEYANGDDGYSPLWKFGELVAAAERELILDMCGEGLWDGAGIRFHLEKRGL